MALLWPIISLWGTTNTLEWAHCIGGCCCRWLRFGSLFFWEALPMCSDGPIALADAAANGFALAHYLFVRHFQCIHMGPLHLQILLPIASLRPAIFCKILQTHSLTSAYFLLKLCCYSVCISRWSVCRSMSMSL